VAGTRRVIATEKRPVRCSRQATPSPAPADPGARSARRGQLVYCTADHHTRDTPMLPSRWLRNWMISSARRRPMTARRVRPQLEGLEDGVTPAVRTWTGAGANDLWSNAANWDTGVPLAADDVRIPGTAASAEVLFDGTATAVPINSLTSDGTNPVGEPFRI